MTDRETVCLFEEPYWLDAVAPGQWRAAEVHRNGKLIGRLPYVVKKKFGMTSIGPSHFTNWLSPWIRPSGGKQSGELSHQHEILGELIKQLPKAERTLIAVAPEHTNLMAFHWAGYKLRVGYTHRLKLTNTTEAQLWEGFRDKLRNSIRKAEKSVTINTSMTVEDFEKILVKTFERQGINIVDSIGSLRRLDAVLTSRGQRQIFSAVDAENNVHAAVYVVYDDRHAFYLAGGGDPEFRQSGGHGLAMWAAIKHCREIAPVFDFLGSMVPNIELFARSFGTQQVPRFFAETYGGAGKLAHALQILRH